MFFQKEEKVIQEKVIIIKEEKWKSGKVENAEDFTYRAEVFKILFRLFNENSL